MPTALRSAGTRPHQFHPTGYGRASIFSSPSSMQTGVVCNICGREGRVYAKPCSTSIHGGDTADHRGALRRWIQPRSVPVLRAGTRRTPPPRPETLAVFPSAAMIYLDDKGARSLFGRLLDSDVLVPRGLGLRMHMDLPKGMARPHPRRSCGRLRIPASRLSPKGRRPIEPQRVATAVTVDELWFSALMIEQRRDYGLDDAGDAMGGWLAAAWRALKATPVDRSQESTALKRRFDRATAIGALGDPSATTGRSR